jgi:hypothetical protein
LKPKLPKGSSINELGISAALNRAAAPLSSIIWGLFVQNAEATIRRPKNHPAMFRPEQHKIRARDRDAHTIGARAKATALLSLSLTELRSQRHKEFPTAIFPKFFNHIQPAHHNPRA